MIIKTTLPVPVPGGTMDRRVYIYLPTAYEEEPERRFPVLYMFDGQNVFYDEDATYGKSWGLGEYLDYSDTPLIVAAVESDPSPSNGRLEEYSPYSFRTPEFGSVTGRGEDTLRWFTGVFKPMVDGAFRTLPGREDTFIAGSSMGGLMSLYALARYNRVFSRAAALSPTLMVHPRRLEGLIRNTHFAPDTVLYMDYGQQELPHEPFARRYFGRLSQALAGRGVLLTARVIPEGTHCEASWEQQAPFFIPTLMYGREE